MDGISIFFLILTTFLIPICILASWEAIATRVREFMIAFLVMETLIVGVFCSLDLVMFYIFFEGQLIPMFLIIGIWGGARRVYSAFKFFLYTLVGSVLFLLAILFMYLDAGTTDIPTLSSTTSRRRCRPGSGSRSSPRLPSSCRCGRSTPGSLTRTWRRRRRVR